MTLRRMLRQGVESARTLTRCRVLLLADQGKTDKEIMEALGIVRNTVKHVRKRYIQEGIPSAIHERPRTGAPLKFSGRERAKITALACSRPPEGRNVWTLRLLADKVVELGLVDTMSHQTVKRILKKTNSSRT